MERAYLLRSPARLPPGVMVTNLAPAKPPTYVKVANFPCLYRHSRSGRYYGCKKVRGDRREKSLETSDRKIRRAQAQGVDRQHGQGGCRGGEDHLKPAPTALHSRHRQPE